MIQTADAAQLVARIQAGERDAEAELYRRYHGGIAVILRRTVGRSGDIEDFSQEAFRLAIEKIRQGELRDPERLSGFMCGLARNLAIGAVRRDSRREPEEEAELSSTPPRQLDNLLEREKAAMVRRVLDEMNRRDREVLCRFYLAEEDKESICARCGLSSLHFNRVLFRARERYRSLYEKKFGPGWDRATPADTS
jgi:RNA polymerase sigma-70 factor, ECF subfamily